MKPKSFFVFLLILATISYSLYNILQRKNDILPNGIESSVVLIEDTDIVRGCGVLIFALSQDSLDEIREKKLLFFNKSVISHSKKHYGKWKETPFEEENTSENLSFNRFNSGLKCAKSKIFAQYSSQIQSKVKSNGSYYSEHNEGRILVDPDNSLVVYSYSD
jgi:hypothetical protein